MSKILFGAFFGMLLSLTAYSAGEEHNLCEDAVGSWSKWSVQMLQDASDTKSGGECRKEVDLAKQSFPKLIASCNGQKFSDIPSKTRDVFINHLLKGITKPSPDVKLTALADTFRMEAVMSVEEKCKKFPGEQ